MLVKIANGKLLIKAAGDWDYASRHIPGEIDWYQKRMPADTPVRVIISTTRKPESGGNASNKAVPTEDLDDAVERLSDGNRRGRLTYEGQLGESSGGEIVAHLTTQLDKISNKAAYGAKST